MNPNQFYGQNHGLGQQAPGQPQGQPGQAINMFNNVQQMLAARSGSPHLGHQAPPGQSINPQLQQQLGQFRQLQQQELANPAIQQYPPAPRLPMNNLTPMAADPAGTQYNRAEVLNRAQLGQNMQHFQAGSQFQAQSGSPQWAQQAQQAGVSIQTLQALQQQQQAMQTQQDSAAVSTNAAQQRAALQQHLNNMKPEQRNLYLQILQQKQQQQQQQQQQAQQSQQSQQLAQRSPQLQQQPLQSYQSSPQLRPVVPTMQQSSPSLGQMNLAAAQQLQRQLSSQGGASGSMSRPMTPPTVPSNFTLSPQLPTATQLPRQPSTGTGQQAASGLASGRSTTQPGSVPPPSATQASTQPGSSRPLTTFDPRQFVNGPPTASPSSTPVPSAGLQARPQNLSQLRRPSTESNASLQAPGTPAASSPPAGAASSPAATPPLPSAATVASSAATSTPKAGAKPRPRKQAKKEAAPAPPPVLFSVVQPTKRDPPAPAPGPGAGVGVPGAAPTSATGPSTPVQHRASVNQMGMTPAQTQAALDRIRQRELMAERERERERDRSDGREVRRAPVPPPPEPTRRKREADMRGSMRNEISRLMYAAGDVIEPDVDTVDFMEDMVVEFLADLCRPVRPIRSHPLAAHQPILLTNSVVRHRLASHSSLRKYLERFDIMTHMSGELAASRRLVQSNENLQDAIATVDKEYLGIDEDRPAGKRGRPRRQDGDGRRTQKPGRSRIDEVTGEVRPKRKPGPRKGWKADLAPDDPRRQKRNWRTQRQSSSVVPKSEPQ